jgi:Zn ribbon nucleic-acid-binding protein
MNNCPKCRKNDMVSIWALISAHVIELICDRCAHTWQVRV